MSRADNTRHLRCAAAEKHNAATRRTVTTLERLDRAGTGVTLAGVAAAAGVSRSWLYQQPELLAAAIQLRNRPAPSRPVTQQASDESLRQRLDTANAEIHRLRADNATLRDQLARALGHQRLHR